MTQKQGISQKVAVGDPRDYDAVLKVNADGSINVVAGAIPGDSVVGILDDADARINPATEETLALVQTDTAALVVAAEDPSAVNVYPLPDQPLSGTTAQITGTTSTAVTGMGAPGANLYNYITQITVTNTDASVGTIVAIQDGDGGTTFYRVPAPAAVNSSGIAGAVISFPTPLKQPTANTALYVACVTTSAEVYVSVTGFKAP